MMSSAARISHGLAEPISTGCGLIGPVYLGLENFLKFLNNFTQCGRFALVRDQKRTHLVNTPITDFLTGEAVYSVWADNLIFQSEKGREERYGTSNLIIGSFSPFTEPRSYEQLQLTLQRPIVLFKDGLQLTIPKAVVWASAVEDGISKPDVGLGYRPAGLGFFKRAVKSEIARKILQDNLHSELFIK